LITQRVQLRQDDIPLGEQTVSQVSNYIVKISSQQNEQRDIYLFFCPSDFLSGIEYVSQC
jgi:hypothetical protein